MVRWFALAMAGLAMPTPVEVARGEAHRGAWQQNESDFRYVDDPAVDLAPDGDAVVAWADQARKDVFLERYAPDGRRRFAHPVNVSHGSGTFSWLPRVAVDPNDPRDVVILWQEIVFSGGSHGGEIMFAYSNDGGRSFTAPMNLSTSKEGDGKGRLSANEWHNGSLALARDDKGSVYVAWTEYEGALWLRKSEDRGSAFGPRVRVAGDRAAPARAPSLAIARDGAVHVAWAVGEDPRADIHVATSTDGGKTFSTASTVGASGGHSDAPKLAVDAQGTVHLAFAESERGPHERYVVVYSRRKKGESQFERPRIINGSDNAHFPQLAVDGRGRVHLVWDRYEGGAAYPRAILYARSNDGGETFTAPQRVFSAGSKSFSGSQQGLAAKLAVSSSGEVAIVNSTFRPEQSSHIWLLRIGPGRSLP